MDKINKLEAVKTGASFIVSIGVGIIVANLIKFTTPSDIGKIAKSLTIVGGFILTGLTGDAAAQYTENEIDKAVDMVKESIDPEEIQI